MLPLPLCPRSMWGRRAIVSPLSLVFPWGQTKPRQSSLLTHPEVPLPVLGSLQPVGLSRVWRGVCVQNWIHYCCSGSNVMLRGWIFIFTQSINSYVVWANAELRGRNLEVKKEWWNHGLFGGGSTVRSNGRITVTALQRRTWVSSWISTEPAQNLGTSFSHMRVEHSQFWAVGAPNPDVLSWRAGSEGDLVLAEFSSTPLSHLV